MTTETIGHTEEMRHIPQIGLLIEKLDRDIRNRVEVLYASLFESGSAVDPATVTSAETHFRQLCRWLERVGEQARGKRAHTNHEFNLRVRVRSALAFAVESLTSVDPAQFRHRNPDHYFERSHGECVYASFLVAVWHVERLTEIIATVDPHLSMKLITPPYELPPPIVVEEHELAPTA